MEKTEKLYRVYHTVMEGDNYAGGWVERITDVKYLHQVASIDRVKEVIPITITYGEAVSNEAITEASIQESKKRRKKELKEKISQMNYNINKLEEELGRME